MPLQWRPEGTVAHQLLLVDGTDGPEERVEEWRRVALGEDEVVVAGVFGVRPVVAKMTRCEHGDDVRRRHARRRMPGARLGADPDAVDAELLAQLRGEVEVRGLGVRGCAGHRHRAPPNGTRIHSASASGPLGCATPMMPAVAGALQAGSAGSEQSGDGASAGIAGGTDERLVVTAQAIADTAPGGQPEDGPPPGA